MKGYKIIPGRTKYMPKEDVAIIAAAAVGTRPLPDGFKSTPILVDKFVIDMKPSFENDKVVIFQSAKLQLHITSGEAFESKGLCAFSGNPFKVPDNCFLAFDHDGNLLSRATRLKTLVNHYDC